MLPDELKSWFDPACPTHMEAWVAAAKRRRLDITLQRTDPDPLERSCAFARMSAELNQAIEVLEAVGQAVGVRLNALIGENARLNAEVHRLRAGPADG